MLFLRPSPHPLVLGLLALFLLSGCGRSPKPPVRTTTLQADAFRVESDPKASPAPPDGKRVRLVPLGRSVHGPMSTSAAEIAAYDAASKHAFVVNVHASAIDVLDVADPGDPQKIASADVSKFGKPTSVAVKNGKIAAVVSAKSKRDPGTAVFLAPDGAILSTVSVGHGPDMATFTPDGRLLLTANEGEPEGDYSFDPEGSVSLIDVTDDLAALTDAQVTTLDFRKFNNQRESLDRSVRIFGKNATVAQDLEPEYIAVSPDSKTAWVACQENNAVAVVDLEAREITRVAGLGFKDHSRPGAGFDASDKDKQIRIRPWPVLGMYQPDGMASYAVDGVPYLITCNDGKDRDYKGLNEQCRVAEVKLDPTAFPNAAELQKPSNLGRLRTTRLLGDHNGDGLHEEIFSYGGRSFAIWTADLTQVYDSGDDFERITAERHPQGFNASHDNDNLDDRSDNKGPEPEGVALGTIDGRTFAFIGLERISGIMVYDVTDPKSPRFESYFNGRNFSGDMAGGTADLGPEGIVFVPADQSPIGAPLLIVAYEISGSIRLYRVEATGSPASTGDSPPMAAAP
jgi:hypothetical protein